MDFTYIGYSELIAKLREQGYAIANYHTYKETDRCVILRHDVDNDLEKAAQLAEFEQSLGIRSTYFLLLTSDFYNVFSKESEQLLKQIQGGGIMTSACILTKPAIRKRQGIRRL